MLILFKSFWSRFWTPTSRPEIGVVWNVPPLRELRALNDYPRVDGGPRIYELEQSERGALILVNAGSLPAYNIQVQSVTGGDGQLTFPIMVSVLKPGAEAIVNAVYRRNYWDGWGKRRAKSSRIGLKEGIDSYFVHESYQLADEEWLAQDYLERTLILDYQDSWGRTYQTKVSLRYQAIERRGGITQLEFLTGSKVVRKIVAEVEEEVVSDLPTPSPEIIAIGEEMMNEGRFTPPSEEPIEK